MECPRLCNRVLQPIIVFGLAADAVAKHINIITVQLGGLRYDGRMRFPLASKSDDSGCEYSQGQYPDQLIAGRPAMLKHCGPIVPHEQVQDCIVVAIAPLQPRPQFVSHPGRDVTVGMSAFKQNLLASAPTHSSCWFADAHADQTVAEVIVAGVSRVASSHGQY